MLLLFDTLFFACTLLPSFVWIFSCFYIHKNVSFILCTAVYMISKRFSHTLSQQVALIIVDALFSLIHHHNWYQNGSLCLLPTLNIEERRKVSKKCSRYKIWHFCVLQKLPSAKKRLNASAPIKSRVLFFHPRQTSTANTRRETVLAIEAC